MISPLDKLNSGGEFVLYYEIPRHLLINKKISGVKGATLEGALKDSNIIFASVIGAPLFIKPEEEVILRKANRIREFPSAQDAFNAFQEGRVGAVFSTPLYTHYYISSASTKSIESEIIRDTGMKVKSGIYLSSKRLSEKEKLQIKDILLEMRKDGSLLKFAKEYVDPIDLQYYQNQKPY
jgi:ABC-type amino acid transport substrate-binding protein